MRNKITLLGLFIILFSTFLFSQTPANGTTGVQLGTVSFDWPGWGGFDGSNTINDFYVFEIGTTSGVYSLHTSANISYTSNTYKYLLNNENQIYYWRVTAYDDGILEATLGEYNFTQGTLAPILPADAAVAVPLGNQTFDWETYTFENDGSGENDYYVVNIGTTSGASDFYSTVPGSVTSSTEDINLATALGLTQYFWSVDVYDDGVKVFDLEEFDFTTGNSIVTTLTLGSPVNGLTGVSIEPSFTWTDATDDAGGYLIKISTDGSSQGNFDANIIASEATAQNVASYSFVETHASGNLPLANATTYYWQVVADDGAGGFQYSPIYHFTTAPLVDVTLDYPNGLTEVTTLTYTLFTWHYPVAPGDMKFKVQVKASSTAPTALEWLTSEFSDVTTLSNSTSAYNISFTLIGGLEYYWRVIVLNASDEIISYSPYANFETDGGVITPVPSSPVNGSSVYTNNPFFYWYIMQVPVNLSYDLQVDDNSDFSSPAMNVTDIKDLYFTPTVPLLPGTTYYWRVRSVYLRGDIDNEDQSAWCATQEFTTQGDGTLIVPVPSYPVNNMTVYSTSPFLFWYSLNGGVGLVYDIEYNTDNIFTGTPTVEDVSTLVAQLNLLEPGKTYYWKVRSDNGTSQSDWSATATFQVAGGILGGYPVASFPVSTATTVYTTNPTLLWYLEGSFLGLTGYEIRWKAGSNSTDWNSDYEGTKVINTPYEFSYTFETALATGETYYWAVASTDGAGYSAWSEGAFTVNDGTVIAAPLLLYPIDGIEIFTDFTSLIWFLNGPATGVMGYEVVYSKSDVFEPSVTTTVPATSVPGLSVLAENLTPGATYYWRVRTWYGGSTYSGFSSTQNFVVNPGAAPVQPMIGGPTNVSVNTLDPVFSWVLPAQSESNLSYELVISESEDLSDPVITESQSQVLQISNLENSKKYYWKVRSKTENGEYSYYSNTGSFTTAYNISGSTEEETLPEKFGVSQNYPNPFNPSTSIEVSLPEAGFVTVKVYDVLGREIKTLVNDFRNQGVLRLTWNGDSDTGAKITSGVYFYRVESGTNIATKKMLLLK